MPVYGVYEDLKRMCTRVHRLHLISLSSPKPSSYSSSSSEDSSSSSAVIEPNNAFRSSFAPPLKFP